MYKNIRKQICKNINEMDDFSLLQYITHLSVVDVELLDKIIDFDKMRAYVAAWEEDLEKGKEDVK